MYEPEVNDYVIWTTALGMVHEGWVYFKAEPSEPKKGWRTPEQYITIEVGTKESELKFVRRRVSVNDNTDPDAPKIQEEESTENMSFGAYKSQRHRYIDP